MKYLDSIGDVAAFTGTPRAQLERMLPYGETLLCQIWNATLGHHAPDARYRREDVDLFYANPIVRTAYMLTMTEVWSRPYRQEALRYYLQFLCDNVPANGTVLDWGGGTCEVLIHLAYNRPDVFCYYVDYPGDSFVTWRAMRYGACVMRLSPNEALAEQYDAVICLSTLEHDDRIADTTRDLVRAIKPGGYGVFEVDWVYNEFFPMHLPITAEWRDRWGSELLPGLGMKQIGVAVWRKEDIDATTSSSNHG